MSSGQKPSLIGLPDDPFVHVDLALRANENGITYQVDFNESPPSLYARSDQPRGGVRKLGETFGMWSVVRDEHIEQWLVLNKNGEYLRVHPVFKLSEALEDERRMWALLMGAREQILGIADVSDEE